MINEKFYDAESYLRQFTPQQWLEAYISLIEPHAEYVPINLVRTGFALAQSDGWRLVAPFWMREFETVGIKPLEEFRIVRSQ